jgi:putative FmdB family regulatory protein
MGVCSAVESRPSRARPPGVPWPLSFMRRTYTATILRATVRPRMAALAARCTPGCCIVGDAGSVPVPKYDFRCDACGAIFEQTRSFGASADPAACPHDGASATKLFSPPMDLLMYRREPVVSTRRVTIPPGALSCHDHGPPPGAETTDSPTGSRWHATGYNGSNGEGDKASSGHGHSHSHGRGHSHSHGQGHSHSH